MLRLLAEHMLLPAHQLLTFKATIIELFISSCMILEVWCFALLWNYLCSNLLYSKPFIEYISEESVF